MAVKESIEVYTGNLQINNDTEALNFYNLAGQSTQEELALVAQYKTENKLIVHTKEYDVNKIIVTKYFINEQAYTDYTTALQQIHSTYSGIVDLYNQYGFLTTKTVDLNATLP